MRSAPHLTVLVSTLEPTSPIDSAIELITWLTLEHPEIEVRVIATAGGARLERARSVADVSVLDDTPEAAAGRMARRVGLRAITRAARSRGMHRLMRPVTGPVLVMDTAGHVLNWLEPAAGPVVARQSIPSPGPDARDGVDRTALEARVDAWADGPDLFSPPGERDDEPALRERTRARLDAELGTEPGMPLVLIGADPGDHTPEDDKLRTVWDLVAARPGLRVLWASTALAPEARCRLERYLVDAGLGRGVIVHELTDSSWKTIASVDAVLAHPSTAAGDLGDLATRVAPERTVWWPAGPRESMASTIVDLLPGGPAWTPPDDRWHTPVGGPPYLHLLGLAP